MRVLDCTRTRESIIAWRAWVVVPFERLDGSSTYRLHVVGNGSPRVWEPRRPTVAVCAAASLHEAPQVNHRCGVWALKDGAVAKQVAALIPAEGFEPYARGQVSLWGRVIEHKHGYRAQYAYPYAITVCSPDEQVAKAIRSDYAVDVEWIPVAKPAEKPKPVPNPELEERKRRLAALPELPMADGATVDELLEALFIAIVAEVGGAKGYARRPLVRATDVTSALMFLRGVEGVVGWRQSRSGWSHLDRRNGFASRLRVVARALQTVAEKGLARSGQPCGHLREREWRIEPAGQARLTELGWPKRIAFYRDTKADPFVVERFNVASSATFTLLAAPPHLFMDELRACQPGWREQRLAAKTRGHRAWVSWYASARRDAKKHGVSECQRVALTEEEVLSALRKHRQPVLVPALYGELAPGRVTKSESAWIGMTLSKLSKDGLVLREEVDGKLRWAIVWNDQ